MQLLQLFKCVTFLKKYLNYLYQSGHIYAISMQQTPQRDWYLKACIKFFNQSVKLDRDCKNLYSQRESSAWKNVQFKGQGQLIMLVTVEVYLFILSSHFFCPICYIAVVLLFWGLSYPQHSDSLFCIGALPFPVLSCRKRKKYRFQ